MQGGGAEWCLAPHPFSPRDRPVADESPALQSGLDWAGGQQAYKETEQSGEKLVYTGIQDSFRASLEGVGILVGNGWGLFSGREGISPHGAFYM